MLHFDVDDLGQFGGQRFFDFGQQAWQHVQKWRPKALGQRPLDWMTRDLLIGGMQSDGRNWAFRVLRKSGHPLTCTDGFCVREAYMLTSAKVFLFLHFLAVLRASNFRGMDRYGRRLERCPPNLYLAHTSEGTDLRACDLAHICPFCLSRRAHIVYSRLRGQPDFPRRGELPQSIYVLLTVQASTHLEQSIGDWVSARRSNTGRKLKRTAIELGGSGGVSTWQLMPHCNQRVKFCDGNFQPSSTQGYTLRCSQLFVVPIEQACDWALDDRMPEQILQLDSLCDADADAHGIIEVETDRDALRSLIFGEAPGNPNSLWLPGQPSLLAYPQLHLAMPRQIAEILNATKNKQLFSFWGSWRRGTAIRSTQNDRTRNSIAALENANANRASQADHEAARIRQDMEPQIREYHTAHGRLPGRMALQQLARDNDINLPDRLARRVAKLLNDNTQTWS